MASDAQINANRKNAARSTGPRSERGKSKVRQNALKHGGRARTIKVMPVLPQEDPKELEERIQAWLDDWQPRDGTELDLVRRGAKLTCFLERGERVEVAHLTHRVRKAERKAGPEASARAIKRVNDLGHKLFYDCRTGMLDSIPAPPWDDDPAVFVAGLEETVLGCRWLLDRWAELRTVLDRNAPWLPADVFRLVRLLGKLGYEAVHDPALNAIFLARDVLLPGSAETLWKQFMHMAPNRDPAFNVFSSWRDLAPRPAGFNEARMSLRAVMSERVERLERIISELEQTNEADAEAEAAERLDRAAFDPSPAFDRHRRHQSSMGHELLRTVDTLRRLRKMEVEPRVDDDQGQRPGASASTPPTQPRGEGNGESQCTCSPRGWGGESGSETAPQVSHRPRPGASATTPLTQPRGDSEADSGEENEHESTTIKAKLETAEGQTENEVKSTRSSRGVDDQSQSDALPGDPSWDKIPILSSSSDHYRENDKIGILSQELPRGWGGGSRSETTPQESHGQRPGASASTPPTQPRGESDADFVEGNDHENATNKAKLEAMQDSTEKEVTSKCERRDDDERSHSGAAPGDP